jgi:hypothetical protein
MIVKLNNDILLEALPHGSGINFDWDFEEKDDCIVCSNSYDYMDENGFYTGDVIGFSFEVPILIDTDNKDADINRICHVVSETLKLDWKGISRKTKRMEKGVLDSYLYDTITLCLSEYIKNEGDKLC